MKYETAGDPVSGLKWTRKTTEKISQQLKKFGISISANTVCRLLKKLKYSLKVNCKKNPRKTKVTPKERDKQFKSIFKMRKQFEKQGDPIISIDTKSKDKVGSFKNAGQIWCQEQKPVNEHDFPSEAIGTYAPYGLYDTQRNTGTVFVGKSHDTPEFSVDCIERWWNKQGQKVYPKSNHILILADSGGSNSYRSRVWKRDMQNKICDKHRISATVCHYAPGTSKWNPIEHRLFSQISKNWAGEPLESYEKILKFIRTTKTKTGLSVKAYIVNKEYKTGVKVCDEDFAKIRIKRHSVHPNWNYTLTPRKMGSYF